MGFVSEFRIVLAQVAKVAAWARLTDQQDVSMAGLEHDPGRFPIGCLLHPSARIARPASTTDIL